MAVQALPRRLVITRDASVWYTDYAANALGRYDPKTGSFREWETPDERAGPYAIASVSDGRIWYVETLPDPNLLVGFDPVNETIFSITPIPSGDWKRGLCATAPVVDSTQGSGPC